MNTDYASRMEKARQLFGQLIDGKLEFEVRNWKTENDDLLQGAFDLFHHCGLTIRSCVLYRDAATGERYVVPGQAEFPRINGQMYVVAGASLFDGFEDVFTGAALRALGKIRR